MTQTVTKLQCAALVMTTILPTAVLILPKTVMNSVAQDAWISLLVSTLGGVVAAFALGRFAAGTKGGVPFQKGLGESTGRVLAALAGLALAAYYFSIASTALHEFITFISAEMLEYTPKIVLKGAAVLVLMYIAAKGIEPIARISVLLMLTSFPLLALSVLLTISKMTWRQIEPVGEHSWTTIALGGVTPLGWFSEVAIVLLVAPYMIRPKEAVKGAVWGVLLTGTELIVMVLQSLFVFGPNLVRSMEYSMVDLVGLIEVGNFVERVEVFFITFWMSTVFLKLGIFLFGTIHLLETTLKLPFDRSPLLLGVGLLLWADTSYNWPHDMNQDLTTGITTAMLLVCNLLFPLALAVLGRLMRANKQAEGGADA
ncbi:endospore germination permease [Cohnella thailandensis]|uniref:Endospore germination permease n=1 Tax=Cohnella thailandensis TaxID=557557 RepID=A0A841T5R1_9BACL|nr:endospore germination permease [Cohnella thailandensis]MBP1976750.1 spore germination protein KB [Cohnella thailandensis]